MLSSHKSLPRLSGEHIYQLFVFFIREVIDCCSEEYLVARDMARNRKDAIRVTIDSWEV